MKIIHRHIILIHFLKQQQPKRNSMYTNRQQRHLIRNPKPQFLRYKPKNRSFLKYHPCTFSDQIRVKEKHVVCRVKPMPKSTDHKSHKRRVCFLRGSLVDIVLEPDCSLVVPAVDHGFGGVSKLDVGDIAGDDGVEVSMAVMREAAEADGSVGEFPADVVQASSSEHGDVDHEKFDQEVLRCESFSVHVVDVHEEHGEDDVD